MPNEQGTPEKWSGLEIRARIDDHFVRSLLLLNGGAIVVALGFVQAIWSEPERRWLLPFVCAGSLLLLVGLTLAASANALRRRVSRLYAASGGSTPKTRVWERISWGAQWASLGCFVLGVLFMIVGLMIVGMLCL